MKALLLISFSIIIGCGQPNQVMFDSGFGDKLSSSSLQYSGFLVANICQESQSLIVHEQKAYLRGSKSTDKIDLLLQDVKENKISDSFLVDSNSCERVYPLEFNGEFEIENNILSNDGNEQVQVIQIHQFRLSPK